MSFDIAQYINVQEAALRLGYTPANVSRLIRTGQLQAIKRGRRYLILPEAIDEYILDQASGELFK